MNAKEVIKFTLQQSQGWLNMLLEDMKSAPTTFPTSKGGNHPLWIMGHLAIAEASMVSVMIQGEANPLAKWEPLFGMGSVPEADASKYPSWDELTQTLTALRAKTFKVLDGFSEADLDKPSKAPPEFGEAFSTVGRVLQMITAHSLFHTGQVADARRALGKSPKFG